MILIKSLLPLRIDGIEITVIGRKLLYLDSFDASKVLIKIVVLQDSTLRLHTLQGCQGLAELEIHTAWTAEI